MTVAAFWISGVGSQQSREIAFQYYDKVSCGASRETAEAAERDNELYYAPQNKEAL